MFAPRGHSVVFCTTLLLVACVAVLPALAQDERSSREEGAGAAGSAEPVERQIEELRKLLDAMRQSNDEQVLELRKRIAELEQQLDESARELEQDELDALRAEAAAETSDQVLKESENAEKRKTMTGGQRSLQALNPEISFVGDFSYDWTSGQMKDGFLLRSAEIGFQAALDPYTRFKAFLGGHQDPFELELGEPAGAEEEHGHAGITLAVGEAYVEWVALPTNLQVYAGKFRQQYGTINRWHKHALPSVDTPFALHRVFGYGGLNGIGAGARWQLPRLWASANSLTLEVTNADNPKAFAGSDWRTPTFLLRHTGFFDLGPDAYFDLGLNATWGPNDASGDDKTLVAGIDVNYLWEPVNRARYRNLMLRGEWIHTEFDEPTGDSIGSDSFYLYAESRLDRRWIVGLRYDNAEIPFPRYELYDPVTFEAIPFSEGLREQALTPYLTWWQSEFVRLRFQYQYADRDFAASWGAPDDHKVWVQVTFAAGPHKHEAY